MRPLRTREEIGQALLPLQDIRSYGPREGDSEAILEAIRNVSPSDDGEQFREQVAELWMVPIVLINFSAHVEARFGADMAARMCHLYEEAVAALRPLLGDPSDVAPGPPSTSTGQPSGWALREALADPLERIARDGGDEEAVERIRRTLRAVSVGGTRAELASQVAALWTVPLQVREAARRASLTDRDELHRLYEDVWESLMEALG